MYLQATPCALCGSLPVGGSGMCSTMAGLCYARMHDSLTPRMPKQLSALAMAVHRYDLTHTDIAQALAHEGRRIFRDRLVDEAAEAAFDALLDKALRSVLGCKGGSWTGWSGGWTRLVRLRLHTLLTCVPAHFLFNRAATQWAPLQHPGRLCG